MLTIPRSQPASSASWGGKYRERNKITKAALLQCALDDESGASGASGRRGKEWGALTAVSMAAVSRYCAVMMEACVGLRWEAKIDVRRWLQELEDLQVTDGEKRVHARPLVFVGHCV